MDNSKCIVLVPVASTVEPECENGLRALEARGYKVFRLAGCAQIDNARNKMSTGALNAGMEEIMWIDSDIEFNPDDVDRLRSHGLPLVCGIYARKAMPTLACYWKDNTPSITFGVGGGLVELDYAATGFMYTQRKVYDDIKRVEKLPECNKRFGHVTVPFFNSLCVPDGEGFRFLGDDYAFCERAKRAGYKIMADTTIRLWHIGKYKYGWEDAYFGIKRVETFEMKLDNKVS